MLRCTHKPPCGWFTTSWDRTLLDRHMAEHQRVSPRTAWGEGAKLPATGKTQKKRGGPKGVSPLTEVPVD
jgi:hypothetical protein